MTRCTRVDPGATPRLRFDYEIPIHELQSLTHADEAEPSSGLGSREVESVSSVADHEMDLVRRSPELHFEALDSTVFRRIVERLLENSEEAQRNVRGQLVRHIMN